MFSLNSIQMSLLRVFKAVIVSVFTIIVCVVSSLSVYAVKYVYETYVSVDKDISSYVGGVPGEQFGSSLASGDFNGDGYDDLVASSPFFSIGDKTWNGSVRIIFGGSNLNSDVVFLGQFSGDQFGTSLAVGDYNNDNYDDLAVGAYNALQGTTRPGKVYIYFGKSEWGTQTSNFAFNKPDVDYTGMSGGNAFGLSLYTQDINNDLVDDLLVGAPFASNKNFDKSGVVYGFYGAYKRMSSSADIFFYGQGKNERFGASIAGGDLDMDGLSDVVVGAYFASSATYKRAGRVYLFSGVSKSAPLVQSATDFIEGAADNEGFGFSIDTGDFNGDEKSDLIVGSFPYFGDRTKARVSVFFGGEKFGPISSIDVKNPLGEALLGSDVLFAKLDSDASDDIVIGAPGVGNPVSSDSGDVYIIYSSATQKTFFDVSNKDVTSIIHGENEDDWFGYALTDLDFDGDGFNDLAISSMYSDYENSINSGKVFVLYGDGSFIGEKREIFDNSSGGVSRGEFISAVVQKFDLKTKKADEIENCYAYREFCFFNFLALSSYDEVSLEPELILYPDISTFDSYYEDVIIGTIFGLVNGYAGEEDSPFHPERPVTRIQALKVVLGASELLSPIYKFEQNSVAESSYFSDINPQIPGMWWYARYVNFALDKGFIDAGEFFRPDDNISSDELNDLIDRVLKYINARDEETKL